MLLRRRHRHHGGEGGGTESTGLFVWGKGKQNDFAAGYEGDASNFPQAVPSPSNILQYGGGIIKLILDRNRRIWAQGANGAAGAGGQGTAKEILQDWTPVLGGTVLYEAEIVKDSKTTKFEQPTGPTGPVLPTQADVSEGRATWTIAWVAGEAALMLAGTTDGRVLTWGAVHAGAQGWDLHAEGGGAVTDREEGKWPTRSPWWIMTDQAPGTGTPPFDPRSLQPEAKAGNNNEGKQLTKVIAGAAGAETSYFLRDTGELWYAGSPKGGATVFLATKDPLSDTIYKPGEDPELKPVALVGTKSGVLLLRKNGKVVWVGNAFDYSAGDGKSESAKTNIREVLFPKLATAGNPQPAGVEEIAKGENAIKIRIKGVVYTAGSNAEYQQGVINPSTGLPFTKYEPQPYLVPMTTLNEHGRKVVQVVGAGESAHGPPPFYAQTPGVDGNDTFGYVLDDLTVRVSGIGWIYNSGNPEKYEPICTTGQGDTMNRSMPIEPNANTSLPRLKNIRHLYATSTTFAAVEEPGTSAPLSIETHRVGTNVTVIWRDVPGAVVGEYPMQREPEGFIVTLKVVQRASAPPVAKVNLANRDGTGKPIREWTFTGIAAGEELEAEVEEVQKKVRPTLVGAPTALSAPLSTAANITSLPVTPLVEALLGENPWGLGSSVTVSSGIHEQTFTVAADIYKGATFIPVESTKPTFAFPEGSLVTTEGWVQTASAGVLSPQWATPTPAERAYIYESQHVATFTPSKVGTPVALTVGIAEGATVTVLTVGSTPEPYKAGELIAAYSGTNIQMFEAASAVVKHAATIPVQPATAEYEFKIGATVVAEYRLVLTSPLVKDTIITALSVPPIEEGFSPGDIFIGTDGTHSQLFTVKGKQAVGTTPLPVHPIVAQFNFAATKTTFLQQLREDWKRADPDATGTSMTTTPQNPTLQGIDGQEYRARLEGAWPGYLKTRKRLVA